MSQPPTPPLQQPSEPQALSVTGPHTHAEPASTGSASTGSASTGPVQRARPVVPVGTLMVIAFLFLNIVFLWMLVLGIQQGRAG